MNGVKTRVDGSGNPIARIFGVADADTATVVDGAPAESMVAPQWNVGTSTWDETAPQNQIDTAMDQVRDLYKARVDVVAEGYRQRLQTSGDALARVYDIKRDEARAWDADNQATTPLLDAEIAKTAETKSVLVAAVITNDNSWMAKMGDIEGIRRVRKTAIGTATTEAAMENEVAAARSEIGALF